MNHIKFVDILSVDDKLKEKVRRWRNKERIRRSMLTQHQISKEEHFRWIENLRNKDNYKFWVVFANDVPIGSVYLQNISYRQLKAEWGFYIGEDAYVGKGLSTGIVYKLLHHFFEAMKFDVLLTEAFSDNTVALNIYRKFKFAEINSLSANGGKEIVTLSFSRADWERCKGNFENVYF